MHVEEFVGLAKPVPCTVILPIHVHGPAIRFNRRVRVLHLDILVAHQRPGGEVRPIELRSTPEVSNGLFMFCSQRVVVTYCISRTFVGICSEKTKRNRTNKTAYFWTVFVEGKKVMRESGQCQTVLCNIQDVGVNVNVIDPAGVNREDFRKLLLCSGKI